jgi:hypothetical protein
MTEQMTARRGRAFPAAAGLLRDFDASQHISGGTRHLLHTSYAVRRNITAIRPNPPGKSSPRRPLTAKKRIAKGGAPQV